MGNLTAKQKQIMYNNGFLRSEIKSFDRGTTPDGSLSQIDFHSGTFQDMISSRNRWFQRVLRKEKVTPDQVRKMINKRYRGRGKLNPFEFLRAEYNPPKGLTRYAFSRRLQARERIAKRLGARYTLKPVEIPWKKILKPWDKKK